MTLLLTMFAPDGIYQSSDNRLSIRGRPVDDDAVKHLAIICHGGASLVGFTGLAVAPDGRHVIDWIKETILGFNGGIEDTLDRIGERADAEFPKSKFRGEALEIVAGVYSERGPLYVRLSNVWVSKTDGHREVRPGFYRVAHDVPTYRTYPAGSGARYVSQADRSLVTVCSARRPRSYEDYFRLLATVTRRAAAFERTTTGSQTVSERCYTANMPAGAWPLRGRSWHEVESPFSKQVRPIPVVVGGQDVTPKLWEMVSSMKSTPGGPLAFQFVFGPADRVTEPDPDARRRTRRSRRRATRIY